MRPGRKHNNLEVRIVKDANLTASTDALVIYEETRNPALGISPSEILVNPLIS